MSCHYISDELMSNLISSPSWEPWRHIKRISVLRSSFVKKKYMVQYEWRTYFRVMQFKHLTGSTADTFLEYIERNVPEGVALKVYKTQIERIPDHIAPDKDDHKS